MSNFKLRDYQEVAVKSVLEAVDQGIRRQAVVLATGGGKTMVFSYLIPFIKSTSPTRHKTLVLAHREELVNHAAQTIRNLNPHLKVGIDKAKQRMSDDDDVVVASVLTLVYNKLARLQRYDKNEFKAIILDECHHAVATTWNKIIDYFDATTPELPVYVLGFTATMERYDGKPLGVVFDKIVFERNLVEMIKNKDLADIKFSTIELDVDLKAIKELNNDFDTESLADALTSSHTILQVALAYKRLREKFNFKSTLVFCINIDHCRTLCAELQKQGINAQYVTGLTNKTERAEILADFKSGEIAVLCNVLVFTEGTDIPNIDSLFLGRPTKSRPLLVQMIGRGLRLHEKKTHCHVIDIASTMSTGIVSVPTLCGFETEGTPEAKKETEEKAEAVDSLLKSLEKMNLEEEIATKVKEAQLMMDYWTLNVETVDGFTSLVEPETEQYSEKDELRIIRTSNMPWVRLEYDVWGLPLIRSEFLTMRRDRRANGNVFHLTLCQFFPKQEFQHRPYRGLKFEDPADLMTVLDLAEKYYVKLRGHDIIQANKSASAAQINLLKKILSGQVNKIYGNGEEIKEKLGEELSKFKMKRASDLIFAHKYKASSLWVRWELQRMIGPDSKMKIAVYHKVNNGHGDAQKGRGVQSQKPKSSIAVTKAWDSGIELLNSQVATN